MSYIGTMSLRRLFPVLIVAVALGAISMALWAEHVQKLEPCILCLYQRVPFIVTGLLALMALRFHRNSGAIVVLVGLCGLTYLAGAGVAVYQVGVEQHWWVSGCSGSLPGEMNMDQFKASLLARPEKPCDAVDWTIFGFSIATYNVAFSGGAGLLSLFAARQMMKKT